MATLPHLIGRGREVRSADVHGGGIADRFNYGRSVAEPMSARFAGAFPIPPALQCHLTPYNMIAIAADPLVSLRSNAWL